MLVVLVHANHVDMHKDSMFRLAQDDEDKPRGFGFVNFESAEEAAEAVDKLNDHELEGKPLFCGRAQKKSEREANLKQK